MWYQNTIEEVCNCKSAKKLLFLPGSIKCVEDHHFCCVPRTAGRDLDRQGPGEGVTNMTSVQQEGVVYKASSHMHEPD